MRCFHLPTCIPAVDALDAAVRMLWCTPEGSPTRPVAPPSKATGLCPQR